MFSFGFICYIYVTTLTECSMEVIVKYIHLKISPIKLEIYIPFLIVKDFLKETWEMMPKGPMA